MAVETSVPVPFTNWSNEDFEWKWDGTPFFFRANTTTFLEKAKADHFANHLVDREMFRKNKVLTEGARGEMMARCFSDESSEKKEEVPMGVRKESLKKDDTPDEFPGPGEREDKLPFCDFCASKGMRHLKVCNRPPNP